MWFMQMHVAGGEVFALLSGQVGYVVPGVFLGERPGRAGGGSGASAGVRALRHAIRTAAHEGPTAQRLLLSGVQGPGPQRSADRGAVGSETHAALCVVRRRDAAANPDRRAILLDPVQLGGAPHDPEVVPPDRGDAASHASGAARRDLRTGRFGLLPVQRVDVVVDTASRSAVRIGGSRDTRGEGRFESAAESSSCTPGVQPAEESSGLRRGRSRLLVRRS